MWWLGCDGETVVVSELETVVVGELIDQGGGQAGFIED